MRPGPRTRRASLAKRGYASYQFSFDLWLKYNRAVLAHTSPKTRVVTHYQSYFENPEAELRRVCGLLGIAVTDDALAAAIATTNQDLRHSAATLGDLVEINAPAEVLTTYQRLCNEAGPTYQTIIARELASLDRPLPAEDDEGGEWHQRWRTQRVAAMANELVQRVQQAEGSLGELIGQLTSKEQELAALRSKVLQLESAAEPAGSKTGAA